ncbi:conserved hypothetical protein [Culex quinquefasciatus]|uniref:Uncharacterized protein n=1 Tax=Culex quinquefasciatus TaxID=7176 RepID=B0WDM3_CULQU|nr:conserved hypothetical protein [Culex quinquefasciatus]|eukprot:XP_001846807.1 conserved hypothetical protein [Culex quinquefasciatus]
MSPAPITIGGFQLVVLTRTIFNRLQHPKHSGQASDPAQPGRHFNGGSQRRDELFPTTAQSQLSKIIFGDQQSLNG